MYIIRVFFEDCEEPYFYNLELDECIRDRGTVFVGAEEAYVERAKLESRHRDYGLNTRISLLQICSYWETRADGVKHRVSPYDEGEQPFSPVDHECG